MPRLWVLGPGETLDHLGGLLASENEHVDYATRNGERVTPLMAYQATSVVTGLGSLRDFDQLIFVECDVSHLPPPSLGNEKRTVTMVDRWGAIELLAKFKREEQA